VTLRVGRPLEAYVASGGAQLAKSVRFIAVVVCETGFLGKHSPSSGRRGRKTLYLRE
jgi:hypothetical protein